MLDSNFSLLTQEDTGILIELQEEGGSKVYEVKVCMAKSGEEPTYLINDKRCGF